MMGKFAIGLMGLGFLFLLIAALGGANNTPLLYMTLSFGLITIGGLMTISRGYLAALPGIKNNGIMTTPISSRGAPAWILCVIFTGFYILLYWFPSYLQGLIAMLEPFSLNLRGKPADHWFLYGSFYTLAVLLMGVRMILKYRHSRYQIIRTCSVMFFQLILAYLIPAFLTKLNQPEYYFSYFWPLRYNALFPGEWSYLANTPGVLGTFMFFWGAMMTFIATPILTYYFGKRWYCSWVCGCGGLAETLGDPFRHLSNKSLKAWKLERKMIYTVLGFITFTTILLWFNSLFGGVILGTLSSSLSKWYGFFIGAAFAGVIGVGFYPILGSRVWCRFGCPMAAILGILQKKYSRFRITTNGALCISCGNCSTYCEMGIDLRWYAQKGQNIIRASCVGCGVCSAVCPRGVLQLENGPLETRFKKPLDFSREVKASGHNKSI